MDASKKQSHLGSRDDALAGAAATTAAAASGGRTAVASHSTAALPRGPKLLPGMATSHSAPSGLSMLMASKSVPALRPVVAAPGAGGGAAQVTRRGELRATAVGQLRLSGQSPIPAVIQSNNVSSGATKSSGLGFEGGARMRSESGDLLTGGSNNLLYAAGDMASEGDSHMGGGLNGGGSVLSRASSTASRQQRVASADGARPTSTAPVRHSSFASTASAGMLEGTDQHAPGSFIDSLGLSDKQLADLNGVAMTFFYLRPRRGGDGSAYDLEVVTQEGIDKDGYFTLSKEGMTYHSAKESSFTSLRQWEREYKLFHRIAQIRFFMQYRRWKSFIVWKRGLRRNKISQASKAISSNLFLFNSSLRTAILHVRRECCKLTIPEKKHGVGKGARASAAAAAASAASPNALLLVDGDEVYNIEDFVRVQHEVQDKMRGTIGLLSRDVLATVRQACDQVVDEFLKANNIVANHKMTFMERAALRAECRHLTRFVRLVDMMLQDSLKSLVLETVEKLLAAVEQNHGSTPFVEIDDAVDIAAIRARRLAEKRRCPLIRVSVELSDLAKLTTETAGALTINTNQADTEDYITLTPSFDDIRSAIETVLFDSLEVVQSLEPIFSSPEVEMFIMPSGDEEGGEEGDDDGDDGGDGGGGHGDIVTSIRSNPVFVRDRDAVFRNLKRAFHAVRAYIKVFDPFREMYSQNLQYCVDVPKIFNNGDSKEFLDAIIRYVEEAQKFAELPRFADVGLIFVDSSDMKLQMKPSPQHCLNAIEAWIPKLVTRATQELLDVVGPMNPILNGDPSSVEAYVLKKKTKDKAMGSLESFRAQQDYVMSLVRVMEDNAWTVPDAARAVVRMMGTTLNELEANIQVAESKEDDEVRKFSQQTTDECPKLVKNIHLCREALDKSMISDPEAQDDKVIKFLQGQEAEFQRLKERKDKLQEYQVTLKLPVDEFEILEEVGADLNLKLRLWKDKSDWAELRLSILNTPMTEIDIPLIEKDLQRFNKTVFLAGKGLPTNKVVPLLKSSVEEFNPVLPVVADLRNPCLKERHWEKIRDLIGFDIHAAEGFTLSDLITRGVTSHQEGISAVATAAQQEAILEEMMSKVTSIWETAVLEVKPYKDIKDLYVLGDTSEVVTNLDDSLVTINTVLGSRYVGGIRAFVDNWRSKLMLFQETLDEWLTCQRNWMYLETIFSSPDIIRQLPGPAKTFQSVDKSFRTIMRATNDEPNALKAATGDKYRKDIFIAHNANLDQIQKDLEDYLETKRMAFPRFYFLSNDELLEILSQAKEPRAVQPHLRKCFDNLVKLEFGGDDGSVDILAMFSGEGEKVGLGRNLKARGNVEEWLTAVEKRMKESLRAAMKVGLLDYDQRPRDEWIMRHPGQVVATVAQMTWARATEIALTPVEGATNPLARLEAWCVEYKAELQKLIVKIRGSLPKLARYIIVALVTTDVHARDIIDELFERCVTAKHDFLWQQQLRYYWETDIDDCVIKHSDARLSYGYEYMGATSRLVITPLTDRCWLTLTGSYALKLGAAPAGPAGTGKTESSKDLAKAIGIQCVVFNCSDQIDYKMMGKLFRGLAQGGSWVCLDEFNRIDIEVLSVIAQQLLVLREGRILKKSVINFMGIQIPLVDHHVIITMNPGYAGRTELPDNLQVCFRPVSMMVPNYALIAEIMLFAEGFGDAKNLSRKMCKLYILCSEQLSQQPHYDYGLRAVKSVLVMAGGLKRSNPDTPEELVLIRALRDSNIPKFLADDLPLFAAIVQDLFPGVNIPDNDYGELQVALEEEIVKAGLQKVPKFIGKVIQMFDIFKIRFGATLVGPAGVGKTTCYRILASLMSNLRTKGSTNPDFQHVRFRILNPKCISMGELYGEFNPMTQEWHDGLASSIMREFVDEENDDKRWTVFDGPIDALWIENMNTVLDDNMTLCLANGQRIKLKQEMKCLFEVMDLAVASPATVSRIGVVYMTPSDLGWMPYVQSWVKRALPPQAPTWVGELLVQLFEAVLYKGIAYQRKYGKEPVETVDVQLIISMCALFQSLFTSENGVAFEGPGAQNLKPVVEKLFLFSFVWTVGGACTEAFWRPFDEFCHELFEAVCPGIGLSDSTSCFEVFVDVKENKFREWADVIPAFKYDKTVPYFSLMVPTTDTCRFSYLMKSLLTVDKPVFVTGVTGTGKSVTVQSLLNSLTPMPYDGGMGLIPVFISFSAQTQSLVTQSTIEGKLEKKRKNLLGAPSGRKVVVFVDDVNMPLVESYGAQPPIELLRQFLDFKGFYDRDKLFWKDIVDVTLFAGAAPPGGGRAAVTPRFVRHFNVMCIPPASISNLTMIFESILSGFLYDFDPEVQRMCKGAVMATIEVYNKISEELLPTPAKFHYSFNLRDISKVFQGILMIRPRKCSSADTFARLWIHECMRIFCDRLINEEDQTWFRTQMLELSARCLRVSFSEADLFEKPIVFCDFLKPDADPKFYEEVKDLQKLTAVLDDALDNYNTTFPTRMNLVFFTDALTHTVRISRILRQPRGNAMLIGVGGSGKQSLTRMASFVGGFSCLSIEINRGYGINQFREDIKKFMLSAGVEGKETVFLFTDSQIVVETMLEDINNVLNTGEVPNLFPQDETDKIVADMIPKCREAGIVESRDNALAFFVSRVRDKLHIVLCMSPVGDALRVRCRQFPSLINCTTIDWFHGWPESALVSVAERFLSQLELPSEDIRASVVRMSGFVHRSIEAASTQYFNEFRRRVYTTPKSYLDLISLYMSMLKGLQDAVEVKCQRMKVGVQKLTETNSIVDALQGELVKLAPILKEKSIETEELLARVAKDSAEAEVVASKVKSEEAIVGAQAAETAAVAADAQRDLDRAMPALESAVKALKSLTKADITEVKSFTNPPQAVRIVMEAVCVLLGEKESWDSAKKLLGRSDFMDLLTGYDKDNIQDSRLKKLRKMYIPLEEMQPEVVQKVSKAGLGLCLWARAMDVYADVAKEVEPKKMRLAEMSALLEAANATLAEKQSQLKAVLDRVAELKKLCDDTVNEKNRLQEESDRTAQRLVRAEKLTSGLSSEGERWKENIKILNEEKTNLIGDCFLSCACISYYGGFSGVYRDALVHKWLEKAAALQIPASKKFSLASTLGDPVLIREWQNQGLPTDSVSVNNGILVDKCRRWPLIIDPQMQANAWIRKKEELNNVYITTMRDPNLLRGLENCIRLGRPLLIEDVGEQIEPALEPVLQKATFKNGSRLLIRLGDSDVDYDSNFRLYMTSKMPNPHYLPEVCIKVTLINFTVTMLGLESQLLGDVVVLERPDIEVKRVNLMLSMAEDKKLLAQLEAKILQMLSESEGNILDDEVLINTLSESKLTALAIFERVTEAEVTEIEINEARSMYLSIATRGSIIYFVIADLAGIDPMYQYSLEYYAALFGRCIKESEKSTNLATRLNNILDHATLTIYQNICRGLFEKDKLLFSSYVCFQVLRHSGHIHDLEWNLFMRGPGAFDKSKMPPNPHPGRLPEPMFDLLYVAETRLAYQSTLASLAEASPDDSEVDAAEAAAINNPAAHSDGEVADETLVHKFSVANPFKGLVESIKTNFDKWSEWAGSPDPMNTELPADIPPNTVTYFQKLILVKALREDKLQSSIGHFVAKMLGPKFAESPSSSMEDIYRDLDNKTPCIFVLSSGADPTGTLLRFARKKGFGDRMHIVSLGQGQGPFAKALLEKGFKSGDWVVLQNCMLAKSWMPELDRIIFELQEKAKSPGGGGINPDFRFFLTSFPTPYFPVAVLQNGVKMTNEPPRGFRANIVRSFGNLVKEEDFEGCAPNKLVQWKKLLCGLAFFHANIQERRKFGPLGWNIRYAFDESDLETSIAVLRRFLVEQDELPWDALNYVTGQINYGGRVTDDWDRRCLMSVLSIYMSPAILASEKYSFSRSGTYYAPPAGTLQSALEYFESLPTSDDPEVFGMHENANVTFNTNESLLLMNTLLGLQPRSSGGGAGKSSDDIVTELATLYETESCPELLLEEDAGPKTFVLESNGLLNPLAICLVQEMIKFNRLISRMRSTLRDLKRAIKGFIVMSAELDAMYTAFLNNQIPGIWESVSFASLKTLGSWVKDLCFRVAFMRQWLLHGQPATFPLPVFFFPQGFMTASLQTFARKHMEAIDGLSFDFELLRASKDEITEGPDDGVYVFGLFLEGARWDMDSWLLAESLPGQMYSSLPVIHFKPATGHKQAPATYCCPVYKTAVRKGVLSTTGLSTNFVVAVELPTDASEQKWILAGVAALCNLTD